MRTIPGQRDAATSKAPSWNSRRWLLAISLAVATGTALVSGCSDASKVQAEIPGTYKRIVPAGEGLEQICVLDLQNDFKCSFSREFVKKGKITDSGSWTNRGKMITVTLKPKRTNHPPTVLEFKWSGKKVAGAKWDEELYGSDGPGTFIRQ